MLWNKNNNIFVSDLRKPTLIQNKTVKNHSTLAPLLYTPSADAPEGNISNPKFIVRKASKSRHNKQPIKGSFFLHKGNNHPIIKTILQDMGYIQALNKQQCNMIWYQGKEGPKKDNLKKQLHGKVSNYLSNHNEITNKQKLYQNVAKYDPSAVGTIIPKTFVVDFKDSLTKVQANLTEFLHEYFRKSGLIRPPKKMNSFCISNFYGEICIPFVKIFKTVNNQQSLQIKRTKKHVLWIVKPSSLNRGQGIQVISNLKQLERILSEDSQQISVRMYQPEEMNIPNCFVIQQYIMDPLLYVGYKFDIRVWALLRSSKINGLEVYIYKKAYVRLAGHKYNLSQQADPKEQENTNNEENEIKRVEQNKNGNGEMRKQRTKSVVSSDKYIHLTNNAVQKYCREYGALHEGNQLLLTDLVKKLANPKLTEEYLYQKFEKSLLLLINSCKERLSGKASYGSFQLIGLDFMVDSKLNVWLIEANCNPCLEQSSSILKQLLPKMLKQMFQVVKIQKIMGPKQDKQSKKEIPQTAERPERSPITQTQSNWKKVT